MEVLSKFLIAFMFIFLAACGVKGKPVPPAEPTFIGTGEPPALNKKDDKKPNQKRQ